MKFTDIFIQKPVLATVLSLLILVLGLRSVELLSVRQYPYVQNAVITVSTAYMGADAELVAGFITTPLENSIAEANGIDYLTSSSTDSISTVQAVLRLNYDPNAALTEINTKVNAIVNRLPKEAQQPVLTISMGDSIHAMYLGFYSKELPANKITDYLIRVVQPKLQAVEGVQQAEILGGRQFSMRIWLDPKKLSAYAITATDVATVLAANNFIAAAGQTEGDNISINIRADTGLHTVDEFKKLVIRSSHGAFVRLEDVAKVTLGANNYNTAVRFDGQDAIYIGIEVASNANLLTVIENVRKLFPSLQQQLPQGLSGEIVHDASQFVQSSIHEVETALGEALFIVTLVIFLFLGNMRSVAIPVIVIPLSLIGAFFIMLLFGYSINLLTLLALVLAIGLVVDDAIIIVENIHRHMEQGMKAKDAALLGARELAGPIIAISVVLIAVYVPIGFMGGLTGTLFTEFAFTLAGAVGVSAILALTLSPMMCARFMKEQQDAEDKNALITFIDDKFEKLRIAYEKALQKCLEMLPVMAVFALIIILSIVFLYKTSRSELAPQEDQGVIISFLTAPANATLRQTQQYSKEVYKIFSKFSEMQHAFQLDGIGGPNTGIAGMVLKPWQDRSRTTHTIQPHLQQELANIAGAKMVVFQPSSLPGNGGGLPVQFVMGTTDPYAKLNEVSERLLTKVKASGKFVYLDTDLKIDKPQVSIEFDRDKIAELGLTMKDIGSTLAYSLSGGYINYFSLADRSYTVVPQLMRSARLNYHQLLDYSIANQNGIPVPLSSVARIHTQVVPEALHHFQQLNSVTISGVAFPGITLGEALMTMKNLAADVLPEGYTIDFAGQSRQYEQEGSALMLTFFFALVIIFLALAAQFESFIDPIIVLISVPMSICGAMIFICLGVGGITLNIYTEVGLVTLIGLISKHGILIVQFANDLLKEGKSKRQAIEIAAGTRLRPILMTTAAMVLGVVPLVTATGAGAASRFNIGVVIASGLSIGTVFTLFVLPAVYLLMAKEPKKISSA